MAQLPTRGSCQRGRESRRRRFRVHAVPAHLALRFVCGSSVLLGIATIATPTAAQQPYDVADGFRDSTTVMWPDVGTRCVTILRTGYIVAVTDSSCRVVSVRSLGTVDGREWLVTRYRRGAILPDPEEPDTMDLDELVLLTHEAGSVDAQLVWHTVRDRDFEFLDSLQWVPTSHGVFLDLRTCLNGTGGCGDEYLRYRDGRWRYVPQPFTKDLQARLPPGHWLHKGRRLDLETLTGVWPVAAPGDGNCCPSLELPYTLVLVGDTLALRDAGSLRPTERRE